MQHVSTSISSFLSSTRQMCSSPSAIHEGPQVRLLVLVFGLWATGVGINNYFISHQILNLKEAINGRLDGVKGELNGVNGRLDGLKGELNGELKGVNGELKGVNGELKGVNGRLDGLKGEINGMNQELNGRLDGMQHGLDEVIMLMRKVEASVQAQKVK